MLSLHPMSKTLHKYTRPQAEPCDAFVGCAGNEPLQPGSPWHSPEAEDDLTISELWEF